MGNQQSSDQEPTKEIFIHKFSESLLSNHVDSIVCFTDQQWSSDNLLCHTLAKYGGNQYSSERHGIKNDNVDCKSCDIFMGDGGLLPCKKVLFCIVPESQSSDQLDSDFRNEEVQLIVNILEKASKEGFFSIALMIGGGEACLHPTRLIPLVYWKFLMLKSSLYEIHLVTLDESLVEVMKKVLTESHQSPLPNIPPLGNDTLLAATESVSHKQDTTENHSEPVSTDEIGEDSAIKNVQLENTEQRQNTDKSFNNTEGEMMAKSKGGPEDDESVLGAFGGEGFKKEKVQKFLNPFEVKKVVSFSEEIEELHIGKDDESVRFKRTDSNSSVASIDEPLDFVNVMKPDKSVKRSDQSSGDKVTHPVPNTTKQVDPTSPLSDDKMFYCSICMQEKDPLEKKELEKCGHIFCRPCISKHLEIHGFCPVCKHRYSTPCGNQPDGLMSYFTTNEVKLAGYEGFGTIVIEYDIPDGVQTENHPNPGSVYKGLHRRAFLPDNSDGNRILCLLQKAFDRKLIFTVGTSVTTGRSNVTTWSEIHHKTNTSGGPQRFGYPDPTYLRRVYDELMAKGITEDP